MRIKEITEEHILFDSGTEITFSHYRDCCEYNYADFEQLDDIARDTEFEEPLMFDFDCDYGFKFGNEPQKMFFVPCYSDQNGYYSSDVDILVNGSPVGNADGSIGEWYL